MVTRGFTGRARSHELAERLPPGQSLTDGFPVLSAGPTPRIRTEDWSFALKDGPKPVMKWSWEEFNALPQSKLTRDIHCVTKWSKLNTPWEGVLSRRHSCGGRHRAADGVHPRAFLRRLFHQRAGRRSRRRQGDGGAEIRGRADPSRARRAGAAARAASLFLEVGEVGERPAVHTPRRARLLGASRLSHLRRPLA